MTKTSGAVQLYSLSLRREVPITGKDGVPTGEVKHLRERHKGCTYEQAEEIRKKTPHVADAMIEKLRMGVPGKIESSVELGHPVNMQAAAGPRKPRPAYVPQDTSNWSKPRQRAPEARETPSASKAPGGGTYAEVINKMAEEELA